MSQEEQNVVGVRQARIPWLIHAAVGIGFTLLTWPVWRWLWSEWMGNAYYSHGILIGPVALYLAWQRIRNDRTQRWRTKTSDNRGLAIFVGSLGLYFVFLQDKAYYLAAFAVIGLLAGLVWTFGSMETVRKLAFPLGYLLLMVPLPFLDRVTLPLALFTGVCSTALVRFLGLDVTVVGNAVTLPNANLIVGAQCSGINSIIALTALNALVAYVLLGPLWGRVAIVALAVPVAMLGNILRVASLLFVARTYGGEAAFRYYHDYSGILTFVLVLLLLIPLTKLLRCRTLRPDIV